MAAYRWVYDSRHLQARQSSVGSFGYPLPFLDYQYDTAPSCRRRGIVVSGVRRMHLHEEVNPRRAQLVHGWVTVFGRVHHLGM